MKQTRREFLQGAVAGAVGAVEALAAGERGAIAETGRTRETIAVLSEFYMSRDVTVDFKVQKESMTKEFVQFVENCMALDKYFMDAYHKVSDKTELATMIRDRERMLWQQARSTFPDLPQLPYSTLNWTRFVLRDLPKHLAPYRTLVTSGEYIFPSDLDDSVDVIFVPQFAEIAKEVKTERFSQWERDSFTSDLIDIVEIVGPYEIGGHTSEFADASTVDKNFLSTEYNNIVINKGMETREKDAWKSLRVYLENEFPERQLLELKGGEAKNVASQAVYKTCYLFLCEQIFKRNEADIARVMEEDIKREGWVHESGHIAMNRNQAWRERFAAFSSAAYSEFIRHSINASANEEINAMLFPLRFTYDDVAHEPVYGLAVPFSVFMAGPHYNRGHRQAGEWIIDSMVKRIAARPDDYGVKRDERGMISEWLLESIEKQLNRRSQISKDVLDRLDAHSQFTLAIPFLPSHHIEDIAQYLHLMQEKNPNMDFAKNYLPEDKKDILTYLPHFGLVAAGVGVAAYAAKKLIDRRMRVANESSEVGDRDKS